MFPVYVVVWIVDHWLAFLAVFGAVGAAFFVRAARAREYQLEQQFLLHGSRDSIVQSQ